MDVNSHLSDRRSFPVFRQGDPTGAGWFRIPFLWLTADDTLVAGSDANFGTTGDSAENIDCAIRVRPDASTRTRIAEGWEDAFIPYALHFKDFSDTAGYRQQSASLIDGCIVEDRIHTGRLLLHIDAWAWNGGLFLRMNLNERGEAAGGIFRQVAPGDGFCEIEGETYLLLSSRNVTGSDETGTDNLNENTDRSRFDYAAAVFSEPDERGHYKIYRLEGRFGGLNVGSAPGSEELVKLGALTPYTLNRDFEVFKNGKALSVCQRAEDRLYSGKPVPMKVFYKDSTFQIYNTSYILQLYSDDSGRTWHTDKIISAGVKKDTHGYFITGPGRGVQLSEGPYQGRLLMPVYYEDMTVGPRIPHTAVLISDDGGVTWSRGEAVPSDVPLSESAPVEGPDGSVMIFMRSAGAAGGRVRMARSLDGGQTWSPSQSVFGDDEAGVNCQVSAIRLKHNLPDPEETGGAVYPAVALASAGSKERKHGRIHIGIFRDGGLKWVRAIEVTGEDILFAYNCLTELPGGRVGLLYESSPDGTWLNGLRQMYYREFMIDRPA